MGEGGPEPGHGHQPTDWLPCGAPALEGSWTRHATSSLQAVVEEAGVPLGWEGVQTQVLWLRSSELHVGPIFVLIVLQGLVGSVQGADVRLGRELAGDEPLPHDAFGNHRILFAGGVKRTGAETGRE